MPSSFPNEYLNRLWVKVKGTSRSRGRSGLQEELPLSLARVPVEFRYVSILNTGAGGEFTLIQHEPHVVHTSFTSILIRCENALTCVTTPRGRMTPSPGQRYVCQSRGRKWPLETGR